MAFRRKYHKAKRLDSKVICHFLWMSSNGKASTSSPHSE